MRSNARPRSVAEENSWRSSAAALRWAKPAIRRFDWELRPGAQLTARLSCLTHAPTYRSGARETGPALASCFLRSQREGSESTVDEPQTNNLGTTLEHP